ncbi:MAG: AmmeMemoRadiSam system protein A [Desulfovibrio sp.]
MGMAFSLSDAEKRFLSRQARTSIKAGLLGKNVADIPQPPADQFPSASALFRSLGAFVTLNKGKQLRGCIGNIVGREPLYATVWHMAQAAAFADPRFPPDPREWPHVALDISVLDELSPCPGPDAVEVGRHGLVLVYEGRSGVFLPQVPVEQGWDRLAYLDNLCLKAGVAPGSWKLPGAQLFWYEAVVFKANT